MQVKNTLSKRALYTIKTFGTVHNTLHYGCFACGKTHVVAMSFGLYCKRLQEAGVQGLPFVIAGQTIGSIKGAIGKSLSDLWGDNWKYTLSTKDGYYKHATLFGQNVTFAPLGNNSSEKGWRGMSFIGCINDEACLCSEENYLYLKGRIRGDWTKFNLPAWVVPNWYVGMTNPDNPFHWLKKRIDEGDFDVVRHWTMEDALYAGAKEYYEKLLNDYKNNPVYLKRYLYGEWTSADGMVLNSFSMENTLPYQDFYDTEENIDYSNFERVVVGIDWGSSHKTAITVLGSVGRDYKVMRSIGFRNKAPSELVDEVSKIIRSINRTHGVNQIYVDGAGKSYNDELTKRGIGYRLAEKSHEYIQTLNSGFANDELIIMQNCKELIAEIFGYQYKKDNKNDEINRINDDHVDSLRYAYVSDLKAQGYLIKN